MENINILLNDISQLEKRLAEAEDQEEQVIIQRQIDRVTNDLRTMLHEEIKNGNVSKDFIELCARFDSTLDGKQNNGINLSQQTDDNKGAYSLSNSKITSIYTNEEIDISSFSLVEKAKVIYNHTGVMIDEKDEIIVNSCQQGCNAIISMGNHGIYAEKYGENWQQEVENIYSTVYFQTLNAILANAYSEIDKKNKEEYEALVEKNTSLEEERAQLSSEVDLLRGKISELVEEITLLRQGNKEDLMEYRNSLGTLIATRNMDSSFEFTPEEKIKILGALGIQFEYGESTPNEGYRLYVDPSFTIEQTARQMIICKQLGINVTATFGDKILDNKVFEDETQVIEDYNSLGGQSKSA